jgi:hypothetical protein
MIARVSMRRRSARTLLVLAILTLGALAAEVALRYRARTPLQATLGVMVDPPGAHLLRYDDRLGYALNPDNRMTITHSRPTGSPRFESDAAMLTWTSMTDAESHRITRAPSADPQPRATRALWLFGCSFTFGWSVDDDDTMPWLLQQRLPDLEVVNFGVPGYGTVQSLIQFEDQLAKHTVPALSVLVYYDFHEERNTLSPQYRRANGLAWTAWGERNQPYIVWNDGELERRRGPIIYEPYVPFIEYSALMNYVDELIVRWQDAAAMEQDRRREITKRLIDRFASLARENGSMFLLIRMVFGDPAPSDDMLAFCQVHGIPVQTVALPPKPMWISSGMTNLPIDGHPSAAGQAAMADLILPAVQRALDGSMPLSMVADDRD